MPRSGFEREGLTSRISSLASSVSPGRTGLSQRSSSMPGEPIAAARPSMPSTNRRMKTQTVCQPLAIRPP